MGDLLRHDLFLLISFITTTTCFSAELTNMTVWIPGTLNQRDTTVVIDDIILSFVIQSSSEIDCVLECKLRALVCSWVAFTSDNRECRGYNIAGQPFDDKNIWTLAVKNICRLHGYKFHPVFQTCLRFYNQMSTWFNAGSVCRDDNANLIITDSQMKIDAYRTLAQDVSAWVGSIDHNSGKFPRNFRWVNGDTLTVTSPLWRLNEPNNAFNAEHCVELPGQDMLNDDDCNRVKPFACQENF